MIVEHFWLFDNKHAESIKVTALFIMVFENSISSTCQTKFWREKLVTLKNRSRALKVKFPGANCVGNTFR